MARVVAMIFHPAPKPDDGPLVAVFESIRRRNADRHAAGFREAGAEIRFDGESNAASFGERVRTLVEETRPDGVVLVGSGSLPLTNAADWRTFVAAAGRREAYALANNRFSADAIAVSRASILAGLPAFPSDNGLPRWLVEQGVPVDDLHERWRLQIDLDTPLDALLVWPVETTGELRAAGIDPAPVRESLRAVSTVARDPARELIVAGRASAAGLAWLERKTASRTRALIEERGFRTGPRGQRPVRSTLGLILDRDGPAAFGERVAELGDAAIVDSRVLLAHRFGQDETGWPSPEDRFASDLLLSERIADPWLRALTISARHAPIPIVFGGHTLVGPGLRLALRKPDAWI